MPFCIGEPKTGQSPSGAFWQVLNRGEIPSLHPCYTLADPAEGAVGLTGVTVTPVQLCCPPGFLGFDLKSIPGFDLKSFPGFDLNRCFLASQCAACVIAGNCSFPGGRTLHLPWLNFTRCPSVCFSSLDKSFGTTASSISAAPDALASTTDAVPSSNP